MEINYFKLCSSGVIVETYVDTSEKNYISHTEDSVIFIDSYHDEYCEIHEQVTRTRVFDVIRQEQIEYCKNIIKSLQESLLALENANNYDQYKELIYKNK
jgi:predicted ribosome quality control (RQC) complex YloA/Tae2 family protein